MKMNPNTLIHTHWQIAHSRRAGQNLPKSMAAPTLTEKKMKKHEHTTCGIKHWGVKWLFKHSTPHQVRYIWTGK